jgi:hypothetical protein
MPRMTEDDYDRAAALLRRRALRGIHYGKARDQPYLASCGRTIEGTVLIFTRDAGHHTGGWWKNPDYERCWHLSMSAAPDRLWTPDQQEHDRKVEREWLRAFFAPHERLLWAEGAAYSIGREQDVWHWRLFMDEAWSQPILPRGEVYSKEFTEMGWKSFTELVDDATT